jgi:hypothetical protein
MLDKVKKYAYNNTKENSIMFGKSKEVPKKNSPIRESGKGFVTPMPSDRLTKEEKRALEHARYEKSQN